VLNATDIAEGAQFAFTQDHFDRLCSALDPLPVARGVTASSAFPIAFPPVTLTNYPKGAPCNYTRPTWVSELSTDPDTNPPGYALAQTWLSYEKPERHYVHLSDGGLADNIGLRAPYSALSVDQWGLREAINERRIERLVVITVDAKPKGESRLDRSARPASWPTVLNAAATKPMENYSADTVELVRTWFDEWDDAARRYDRTQERCRELAAETCEGAGGADCVTARRNACVAKFGARDDRPVPHPELYRVHVRFDAIGDPEAKRRLQGLGTRLQLRREDVDALVEWGGTLLRESPDYRRLLNDLGAT
jgi:NTE family protein